MNGSNFKRLIDALDKAIGLTMVFKLKIEIMSSSNSGFGPLKTTFVKILLNLLNASVEFGLILID